MNASKDDIPGLGQADPAVASRLEPARAAGKRRRTGRLALLAALAAAAVGVWWILGRGPASFGDLVDREPLPYTPMDLRGAGNPALATIFSLGMAHYAEGDWPAAAEQLARADRMLGATPGGGLPGQPLFAPFLRMYLGVALSQAGRTAEAMAVFDALAAPTVAQPLRERGLWYGAQCRLLTGDGAGAAGRLDELQGSPVYAQPARELAARVRERLRQ